MAERLPAPDFQQLPCSIEAEQTVLGSLMVAGTGWDAVRPVIRGADDFYEPVHQRIFAALDRANREGRIADWRIVAHEFAADPALAEIGRDKYLMKMAAAAQAVVNVGHFARVVAELAIKRRVVLATNELRAKALNGSSAADVLGEFKARADVMVDQGLAVDKIRVLFSTEWPPVSKPRLIDGLLGHDFFGIVYGASYAGKSFLAIDMGLSIALGRPWRGRPTDRGLIVYVAAEGASSVQRRAQAWLRRYAPAEQEQPAFAVIPGPVDLLHPDKDTGAIIAAARKAAVRAGVPLRAVIIDTLAAACPGTKEDSEDFGNAIHNLRVIMRDLGCAVIVIHHSGKDSGRGARGHSSLEAAADLTIEVTEEAAARAAKLPVVRKLRDGREPELWPYQIVDQVIGVDEDGREVVAGVAMTVEPIDIENAVVETEMQKKARELRGEGKSLRDIGRTIGISKSAVERMLQADGGRR